MVSGEELNSTIFEYLNNQRLTTIAKNSEYPNRLDSLISELSFIFQVENERLDVQIIPPQNSDKLFKIYLEKMKGPNFYRDNQLLRIKEKQKESKKYFMSHGFFVDYNSYHFGATLVPHKGVSFLDRIAHGSIYHVVKPILFFEREFIKLKN